MADEQFQERTEKATPHRRKKAREEGKVAKSTELNAAAMICLGFLTLWGMGPYLARQIQELMAFTMANAVMISTSDPTFIKVFTDTMMRFFVTTIPLFAVFVVIAIGVNVSQVGFVISTKSLEPKLDKLNLVSGAKKLISVRSLVNGIRDIIKLIVIGLVAFYSIRSELPLFFDLPEMTIVELAGTMGKLAAILALKIGGAFLVLAVLDYMHQKYQFEKSIKMSKQEIRQENKDTEGSPQLKARVRQIQREVSRSRMMSAVPTADVVVKNPTRLAVALKYDLDEMQAPTIVAKGARLVARKIIEIAQEHNIPVIEDKPLARALFKLCDVGQLVPMNLYRAVAELLAHVYRLKGKVTA